MQRKKKKNWPFVPLGQPASSQNCGKKRLFISLSSKVFIYSLFPCAASASPRLLFAPCQAERKNPWESDRGGFIFSALKTKLLLQENAQHPFPPLSHMLDYVFAFPSLLLLLPPILMGGGGGLYWGGGEGAGFRISETPIQYTAAAHQQIRFSNFFPPSEGLEKRTERRCVKGRREISEKEDPEYLCYPIICGFKVGLYLFLTSPLLAM